MQAIDRLVVATESRQGIAQELQKMGPLGRHGDRVQTLCECSSCFGRAPKVDPQRGDAQRERVCFRSRRVRFEGGLVVAQCQGRSPLRVVGLGSAQIALVLRGPALAGQPAVGCLRERSGARRSDAGVQIALALGGQTRGGGLAEHRLGEAESRPRGSGCGVRGRRFLAHQETSPDTVRERGLDHCGGSCEHLRQHGDRHCRGAKRQGGDDLRGARCRAGHHFGNDRAGGARHERVRHVSGDLPATRKPAHLPGGDEVTQRLDEERRMTAGHGVQPGGQRVTLGAAAERAPHEGGDLFGGQFAQVKDRERRDLGLRRGSIGSFTSSGVGDAH